MTIKNCIDLIIEEGYTFPQAVGIVANIDAESGCNPDALGDLNKDGEFTSYGLCQWHKTRWDRLKKYAGTDGAIPAKTQIQFIFYEMQKFYPKTWKVFNSAPDDESGAEKIAHYFCYNYEVPANRQSAAEKRSVRAADIYELYEANYTAADADEIIAKALSLITEAEEVLKKWKKP